ncbi:hypothetical protein T02_3364 [Trichinella nativa]|uniref:Uncharacterized protein n=1 Tax=Trichinella nativa TaxID=6335 RepID=A0A0V1KHW0_9BILA|nr:hypothetical protein T02_3364 [Trichinella nativa]
MLMAGRGAPTFLALNGMKCFQRCLTMSNDFT